MKSATALKPSWNVDGWPRILWQADSVPQLHLVHLETKVFDADSDGPCSGQTVWGGPSIGGTAGVSFEWVRMPPGVLAMVDPMTVVTNLRLVGPRGQVLSQLQAAPHLNEIVHSLPWQDEVRRALRRVERRAA